MLYIFFRINSICYFNVIQYARSEKKIKFQITTDTNLYLGNLFCKKNVFN